MKAPKIDDLSKDHLEWLVRCRSENQAVSLDLFLILKEARESLQNDEDLLNLCQGMVAIAFSLWRAVFLSDLKESDKDLLVDAESFLGNLILHNAVAYPQDRTTREWTFLYYVNNARYRLEAMSIDKTTKIFLVPFDGAQTGTLKELWEIHHNAFKLGVQNLKTIIAAKIAK